MGKRSNLIVTLGLAVFVVGAAATFLVVRNNGGSDTATAGPGRVTVLVADRPIPAGTQGSAAVNQGMVKAKVVVQSAMPANALTDVSQLAGKTVTLGVAEGQVLTTDQFQTAQTRIGTLKIPDGKTAIAVSMGNVPGVAGFAGAGDHIDVFGVVKPGAPGLPNGGAHLIMQNTEVLNVNGTTLAAAQGQPGGAGLVYLLAVSQPEAERIAFLSTFEQLYFSLVAKDALPVGPTSGTSGADALKQF